MGRAQQLGFLRAAADTQGLRLPIGTCAALAATVGRRRTLCIYAFPSELGVDAAALGAIVVDQARIVSHRACSAPAAGTGGCEAPTRTVAALGIVRAACSRGQARFNTAAAVPIGGT